MTAKRKVPLTVGADYAQGLTRCSPRVGLAELIWNALDADATEVRVSVHENDMGGVRLIEVKDNGTGMDPTRAERSFDRLGESWKKTQRTTDAGRAMHGHNGRGRFKACGLGRSVEWHTTFREINGKAISFQIDLNADNPRSCDISDAIAAPAGAKTGTLVRIQDVEPTAGALKNDALAQHLTEEFAHYLRRVPGAKIFLDGSRLNPDALIEHEESIPLPPIEIAGGKKVTAKLQLVEWRTSDEHRRMILCRKDGMAIADVPLRAHLLDGHVTAYVESDHFEKAGVHQVTDEQIEYLDEVRPIILAVRDAVKSYERGRLSKKAEAKVKEWKDANVYPFSEEPQTSVETIERDVFNIVAVEVDRYLPRFAALPHATKRLNFSLLRRVIETKPEELVNVLTELNRVPSEQLKSLSDILQRHSLINIIKAAKTIDERLLFLSGLDALLHDPEWKTALLERVHLHELVAQNTWIFGEQFNLVVSDQSLTEAVRRHARLAKLDVVVDEPVLIEGDRRGRLDLMITRAMGAHHHSRQHLVIELKRPSVKCSLQTHLQVKEYAGALAGHEAFPGGANWSFWVVTTEMDPSAKREANQQNRPAGLIDEQPHYTVWSKTWEEIIADCRGRLEYLRNALEANSTQEVGLNYIRNNFARNVPAVALSKDGRQVPAKGQRKLGAKGKANRKSAKQAKSTKAQNKTRASA